MGIACLFGHKWNGCTCSRCGTHRDSNHDYQPLSGRCEEKCTICGKTRLKKIFSPYTGNGVCDVCNSALQGKKAWIVPNAVFYASPGYRQHQKNTMAFFGRNLSDAQVDMMILDMAAKDHSIGSAVCEDCIAMFEINGFHR